MVKIIDITMLVLIAFAVLFGFMELTSDLMVNYNYPNQSSDIMNFYQQQRVHWSEVQNYTNSFQSLVEKTDKIQATDVLSVTSSVLLGAILLPFTLAKIIIISIGEALHIIGIPSIVYSFASVLVLILIAYVIIKIILRRSDDI